LLENTTLSEHPAVSETPTELNLVFTHPLFQPTCQKHGNGRTLTEQTSSRPSATSTCPSTVAPAGPTLPPQPFLTESRLLETPLGPTSKSHPKSLSPARQKTWAATVVRLTTLLNGWQTTKSLTRPVQSTEVVVSIMVKPARP